MNEKTVKVYHKVEEIAGVLS